MSESQERYEVATRDDVLVPTWERMKQQAEVLHDSGFFPKVIKGPAQALAIMLAGRELGLGPMESLRSIYIVDGATTLSSGCMAAMIWQAGHAYSIDESTDTVCQITFTRSNGQTYTHRFAIEDAKRARLLGKDTWQQYAKAMLFNRCISAGARAFMPDVTRRMYTPEEMGAPVTVSESGDVVIDAETKEIEEEAVTNGHGNQPQRKTPQKKTNGTPQRPWSAEYLRRVMRHNVGQKADWTGEPNKKQVGLLAGKLDEALGANQDSEVNRHEFLGWITGERSLTKLGIAWIATLLDWLLDEKDEATGDYPFKAHAVKEANAVLRQAMIDQGQQEMPLDETLWKPRYKEA